MSNFAGGYQGPGRYRHYKGGEYEVLGLALVEASKTAHRDFETVVIYRPLSPGSLLEEREESFWTRPRAREDGQDAFDDEVRPMRDVDYAQPLPQVDAVPRFQRIE